MKKKPLRRPPQPRSPVHLEVKAAAPRKINVSAGVIAGNRLAGMTPQYPAIAKAERIQDRFRFGLKYRRRERLKISR